MSERARHITIGFLVALGILSAACLMISAAVEHQEALWFGMIIGCPVLFVGSVTAAVVLVRRWGREYDDFWWPDRT